MLRSMETGSKETEARPGPARFEVVAPEMVTVLQGKSPAERLEISNELWHFAEDLLLARPEADSSGLDRGATVARGRSANGRWILVSFFGS